jgi:23S rRNA (cytidine2498-2'-O)-methyltransferase
MTSSQHQTTDVSTAYLAPEGLEAQTRHFLKKVRTVYGRLIVADGPEQFCPFAQNIWLNPIEIGFRSITDAAAKLKSMQRNWYPYSYQLHRRTELILNKLPYVNFKPLSYPAKKVSTPLGSFTLIGENTLLASPSCTSLYPNGAPEFIENHIDPPSRAYMKLFEAFTVMGVLPEKHETCLELGASPGGWTWVIAKTGAHIIAVDRAPLDPRISSLANVTFRAGDAFTMTPERIGSIDWLISDIICYPEKLFDFVNIWLASGACKNYLLTLKFQGETNYKIIESFASVTGSRLFHLNANKHELTWFHQS